MTKWTSSGRLSKDVRQGMPGKRVSLLAVSWGCALRPSCGPPRPRYHFATGPGHARAVQAGPPGGAGRPIRQATLPAAGGGGGHAARGWVGWSCPEATQDVRAT